VGADAPQALGGATPKRIRRSISAWFEGERFASPDDPDEWLVYDAILAARGAWSIRDLEHAAPDFLAAVRFAMFAERAVKVLLDAKQILAMPSNEAGLSTAALRERLAAKSAAAQDLAVFTAILYPEDEAA
jgi:hypothetical protein